jgi:hypothetical protein
VKVLRILRQKEACNAFKLSEEGHNAPKLAGKKKVALESGADSSHH